VKVLIVGAGGQVGAALLKTVPPSSAATGLDHRELDITNERAVHASLQHYAPDVVVNAAAFTAVERAETEPDLAMRVNADGPRHLASAACEMGARLIHLSTDYVFDGSASAPYRPESPTRPLNVYGATKRAGEELVLQRLPERSIVLRTSWIYAAQGTNFMRTMLRLMAAERSVKVVADQIGSPTAASHLAEAIWRIVARPELSGIHHWTSAGVASWYDFAVAIAEEASQLGLLPASVEVKPVRSEDYPTRARRPRYSVLDTSSLASLGIPPAHWRVVLRTVLGELMHA
jgi:dTDP-4-dehydrorhamnose reductase